MPSTNHCTAVLALPPCRFAVFEQDGALYELRFMPPDTALRTPSSELAANIARLIRAYLSDPHTKADLPVSTRGTEFQRRVWQRIAAIPAGRTSQYKELAVDLNSSARAVGQACCANPLPVLVPCHRVVSATGPGGFAHSRSGWLLETKMWLLAHEGVNLL